VPDRPTDKSDFRLQLSATDYGNFLANEPLPISTATIADKVSCLSHMSVSDSSQATEKLVAEFHYLRTNAVEPLATFMDYITYVMPRLTLVADRYKIRLHDRQRNPPHPRHTA
jgi:hypothetical protein